MTKHEKKKRQRLRKKTYIEFISECRNPTDSMIDHCKGIMRNKKHHDAKTFSRNALHKCPVCAVKFRCWTI